MKSVHELAPFIILFADVPSAVLCRHLFVAAFAVDAYSGKSSFLVANC